MLGSLVVRFVGFCGGKKGDGGGWLVVIVVVVGRSRWLVMTVMVGHDGSGWP